LHLVGQLLIKSCDARKHKHKKIPVVVFCAGCELYSHDLYKFFYSNKVVVLQVKA